MGKDELGPKSIFNRSGKTLFCQSSVVSKSYIAVWTCRSSVNIKTNHQMSIIYDIKKRMS